MTKKLKRVLSVLIILFVAMTIGGYAVNQEFQSEKAKQEALKEQLEAEDNRAVIGFSGPGAESDWRVAHTDSIIETLTKAGYKVKYSDSQGKQDNQIKDIRKFIQQDVDYIILSPIVETGWDSVLQEAKDAEIPVIIADRTVMVDDENLFTAYVGSNFYQEGYLATKWMDQHLDPIAPLNIVHIQGTLGSSAQLGRTQALEEAIAAHDNWNLVAQGEGDFTKPKAYETMKAILQENPDVPINIVYCENDNEAFGVMKALDEVGLTYGIRGDIMIVSFDATHTALMNCLAGMIDLEVECNPLQGPAILSLLQKMEYGYRFEKYKYVEEEYFTRSNLTEKFIEQRAY